jgi:predicted RNA binding protein YcfA (HicA-like mRNA interferase family)
MSNDIHRQVKDVIRNARRQGWRVGYTKKEHFKFMSPNGKDMIICAHSSASQRGFRNFLSLMRKAGYCD